MSDQQTRKLKRRIARLERDNACYQAVQKALYEALERQARGYGAAAYDAGVAEGTQEALAVEVEHRDLLGGG